MSVDTHKLKTPLTAMYGYIQMLERKGENLTEDQKRWVEEIKKQMERLTLMLDGIAKSAD